MASDDGFVIVESELTPSPETSPEPSPEEKNVDERTYEEFINDKTPMETFQINGLRYYAANGKCRGSHYDTRHMDSVRSVHLVRRKYQTLLGKTKILMKSIRCILRISEDKDGRIPTVVSSISESG